jgi:GNAT superfamily N-acetyltransferase
LQKIARQLNKLVICATTHEDLIEALHPSLYIKKGFETDVKCERLHYPDEKIKFKLKDIYDDITITRGEREDYDRLERFHYRQSGIGAVRDVCTMRHKSDIIGAMILTYPHLALKGRNIYTNKKYSRMTTENCKMINKEFSCISRVVIHPKYRGLGLSYHMIKYYFDNFADTKYVETLAVMSKYSPFFEKAGMTMVEVEEDRVRLNKIKRIEEYGFDIALISSSTYNKKIYDKLTPEKQQEFKELIKTILRGYGGAIRKLFGDKKSLEETIEKNLFTAIKEIKRSDTLY